MKLRLVPIIFFLVLLCNCSNPFNKAGIAHSKKPMDTLVFYPINPYIRSQLLEMEQSSISPYQILEDKKGKDSMTISKDAVKSWAMQFLNDSITAPGVQEKYKENIFLDQSTASYTFSYTTEDTTLPVQSVLVLLDTATQQVKDIIYSMTRLYADSIVLEKWWWKNDRGFKILKNVTLPNGIEKKQQINVAWQKPS